ncbi:hypothetical protein MBGDN05_00264, partial [Thermoplasmatales archaeon SCGC AB-539-N05]
MMKRFRAIKGGTIIGMLLISAFIVFMPSSLAGLPVGNGNVMLEYDASALQEHIMPLSGPRIIPITISYMVSGILAKTVVDWFSGKVIPIIDLSVEDSPSWCTAAVEPNVISPEIGTGWNSITANLLVSVNENAPARTDGKIKVKMYARKLQGPLSEISEVTSYAEVTFTPGYLPTIGYTVPVGNFVEIVPGTTANFDLEIENLGNAKTEVVFRVLNVPKGWSPNIIASTILGSNVHGDDPKSTVQLVVQPPYSFGYHNEREVI